MFKKKESKPKQQKIKVSQPEEESSFRIYTARRIKLQKLKMYSTIAVLFSMFPVMILMAALPATILAIGVFTPFIPVIAVGLLAICIQVYAIGFADAEKYIVKDLEESQPTQSDGKAPTRVLPRREERKALY